MINNKVYVKLKSYTCIYYYGYTPLEEHERDKP